MPEARAPSLTVTRLTLDARAAIVSSLRSVFEVIASSDGLRERFGHIASDLLGCEFSSGCVDLLADESHLRFFEMIDMPALGADQIGFIVKPSDRYLELVTAIAGDRDNARNLDFVQGWPVLSVESHASTVAEAAGAAISGGGGH